MLDLKNISVRRCTLLGLAGLTSLMLLVSTHPAQSQEQSAKPGEVKPGDDAPGKNAPENPAPGTDAPADAAPAGPQPGVTFLVPESADPSQPYAPSPAELEVQGAIKGFADAFNAHDAKAVGALFTEFAELESATGQVTRGNSNILETFTKLFAENPKIQIHLEIHSLRFLSAGLSVEEGFSTMMNGGPEGEETTPRVDRYTIIHYKHENAWLVASARDWPAPPPSAEEQLQQLAWLVGDWVDENSETTVQTNYHWSKDNRYLLSRYSVRFEGQEPIEGLQRIGWDPESRQLRSWTFDSVGGFSQGLWSHAGDRWVVKVTGVTGAGQMRSSTNVLTRVSNDHATFLSRDRVVGGELLPDLDAVPIVRKPPEPMLTPAP